MDQRLLIVLGILAVSVFIFLVTVLVLAYTLHYDNRNIPEYLVPFVAHHSEFMVLMGMFGVISGIAVFMLMTGSIRKEQQLVKANVAIIRKFLSQDEATVLDELFGKGGTLSQTDVSLLPGMTRLKAHRIVKKLKVRGIIHVDRYGKINRLRLVQELMQQPKPLQ